MADVTGFLEEAGVDFEVREHARTERAADEATALGIRAEDVAKPSSWSLPAATCGPCSQPRSGSTCTRSAPWSALAARRCIWRVRTTLRATILTSSSALCLRSADARIR